MACWKIHHYKLLSYENLHVVGDFPRSHVWWPEGGGKTMAALILHPPFDSRSMVNCFGALAVSYAREVWGFVFWGWPGRPLRLMQMVIEFDDFARKVWNDRTTLTIIGTSALLLPWSLQFLWWLKWTASGQCWGRHALSAAHSGRWRHARGWDPPRLAPSKGKGRSAENVGDKIKV